MTYRLGVDVGGTFTDLILIDEKTGDTYRAKTPSTPMDASVGVLRGIEKVATQVGIEATAISHVLHGSTVATNAVIEGKGARVGLVVTDGYRQVLQVERSFVPGGLAGWIVWPKPEPLAALEVTVEARERINPRGDILIPLDETALRASLRNLGDRGVEALTVSLINSFSNPSHEILIKEIAREELPDVPVSISSEILPEMREFERTLTTVVNSYVRPAVASYLSNLQSELAKRDIEAHLHILRSDGGLMSVEAAKEAPVNMLMSGPAGGVAGAVWIARQAGYDNLLTIDMGGTSTDVALVQNGEPIIRRETTVADFTIRASSLDVRSVGAGGGSIAHVPELTGALRVGPESAGAEPGPAAYGKGGDLPTVTDANVLLGYLPPSLLGGEMMLDVDAATRAVEVVADGLGVDVKRAAAGIIDIVNENMVGALRLVSVEQGHDPRDYAFVAFGGAGPLHANALAMIMGSWPVIIPPSPGVLCAYGDATTRLRNEASRTFVRRFSETSKDEVKGLLEELAGRAAVDLDAEGVSKRDQTVSFQVDVRYHGQGFDIPIDADIEDIENVGLAPIAEAFDEAHTRLFTFSLDAEHEFVNLRAIVLGQAAEVQAPELAAGETDASDARDSVTSIWVRGAEIEAQVYDRLKLRSGNRIAGPAIVTEMDSTTLVLPGHVAEVDRLGNLIINPENS